MMTFVQYHTVRLSRSSMMNSAVKSVKLIFKVVVAQGLIICFRFQACSYFGVSMLNNRVAYLLA